MHVERNDTASLSGSRWKPVHCSHCRGDWAYRVSRQATGSDRPSAAKKLERALEFAVDEVPCPRCGWYQEEMVARMSSRQHRWLAALGGLSLGAALLTLGLGAALALFPSLIAAGLLVAGGSAALLRRAMLQATFDPNADAFTRARRETGRDGKLILREHYEEVLAAAAAQGLADRLQQIEWA